MSPVPTPSNNSLSLGNTEIKRIPHPIKVPKDQDKIVLNYRFEEVIGYGKNRNTRRRI